MNDTIKIIKKCIFKISDDFKKNPFNFLYESSIQGRLYSLLYDELQNEIKIIKSANKTLLNKTEAEICIVQTEYPSVIRFDIAFIDKEGHPPNESLKNESFWIQPINFAIEIKYAQLGDNVEYKSLEAKMDILKIEDYRDTIIENYRDTFGGGIVLLFMQNEESKISNNFESIEKLNSFAENEVKGYYILPKNKKS